MIDGTALYVGGLDLNDRRYDAPDHDCPTEQTWQDIQAIVRGPVVAAADRRLRDFLPICNSGMPPTRAAPGFLCTISARRQLELVQISPKPVVTEIAAAHLAAIDRADGLIYLETQFFRYAPVAKALARAARRSDRLGCVLILPAEPEDVALDGNDPEDAQLGAQKKMEALDILIDGFGDRVVAADDDAIDPIDVDLGPVLPLQCLSCRQSD